MANKVRILFTKKTWILVFTPLLMSTIHAPARADRPCLGGDESFARPIAAILQPNASLFNSSARFEVAMKPYSDLATDITIRHLLGDRQLFRAITRLNTSNLNSAEVGQLPVTDGGGFSIQVAEGGSGYTAICTYGFRFQQGIVSYRTLAARAETRDGGVYAGDATAWKSVPMPSASVTQSNSFDGIYYQESYRFGFSVTGNQGVATVSNSPTYKPGDVMLSFTPSGPKTFIGQQLCTDGKFHPVTGTLADDGSIDMVIQGCFPSRYKMVRQGAPAPAQPQAGNTSTTSTVIEANQRPLGKSAGVPSALVSETATIATGLPDLMPSDVKVSTQSITLGQTIRVSWTMANKGDGEAKASVTGLRMKAVCAGSLKTVCSDSYITLVREIATSPIAAGRSINMQRDVTVPSDAPAGGYVVVVVADNTKSNLLVQKDTNNDYAQSGEVTLICQSAISTGRPLMADMEQVPEGGFADPLYPRGQEKPAEHVGTDYQAPGGSCVFAVREGVVDSNFTSTTDPMLAVLEIKHGDGSKAYYGHIQSSLGAGSKVARGAFLGTVRYPTPDFGSHLHYGEWEQPSDISIKNPETDCENKLWVTKLGNWGWGRVPLGTTREQMLKCGWIDTGAKYITGWASSASTTNNTTLQASITGLSDAKFGMTVDAVERALSKNYRLTKGRE